MEAGFCSLLPEPVSQPKSHSAVFDLLFLRSTSVIPGLAFRFCTALPSYWALPSVSVQHFRHTGLCLLFLHSTSVILGSAFCFCTTFPLYWALAFCFCTELPSLLSSGLLFLYRTSVIIGFWPSVSVQNFRHVGFWPTHLNILSIKMSTLQQQHLNILSTNV